MMLRGHKLAAANPVQTSPEKRGHPVEVGEVGLSHWLPLQGLVFQIRVKPGDVGHYEIKLFWREVLKSPVARFESRGDGHFNPEDGRGLPKRKIPNPHFHFVREDGRMIAVRTTLLEMPDQEQLINQHYSFGVKHFCQEVRIHDSNGAELNVQMVSAQLPLSITRDPLQGVTF